MLLCPVLCPRTQVKNELSWATIYSIMWYCLCPVGHIVFSDVWIPLRQGWFILLGTCTWFGEPSSILLSQQLSGLLSSDIPFPEGQAVKILCYRKSVRCTHNFFMPWDQCLFPNYYSVYFFIICFLLFLSYRWIITPHQGIILDGVMMSTSP